MKRVLIGFCLVLGLSTSSFAGSSGIFHCEGDGVSLNFTEFGMMGRPILDYVLKDTRSSFIGNEIGTFEADPYVGGFWVNANSDRSWGVSAHMYRKSKFSTFLTLSDPESEDYSQFYLKCSYLASSVGG